MTTIAALKSKVKLVHRWIGISVLVLAAMSAVTGIVIQWDSELTKLGTERSLWKSAESCQPCPLGRAAEQLGAHLADDRFAIDVSAPEFERTAMDATASRVDGAGIDVTRRFVIDPATLAIREIGDRPVASTDQLMTWAYSLHHTLLLGLFGTVLMWIAALLLFIMPLTGLLLWWPMTRSKRGAFVTTKRLRGRAWYYDRHRIIGFYAITPIAFVAATGFLLTLLDLFPRDKPPPHAPDARALAVARQMLRPGVTPMSAQDYARTLYPGLVPVRLQIDASRHEARVSVAPPDGLRPTQVTIDTRSGRPVAIDGPEAGVVGWTVTMARVLHNGEIVGIAGRILNMAVAAVILFLAWSGFAHWRARRGAKMSVNRSRV